MQAWDIEFKDLTVGYGSHIVLHDVNAVLPGGKVSVILGGSGCGKSTLLRHIIGLSRPLSGHVLVGGRDLFALGKADFRRIRRHMGVLFQDGALLGALTLVQNVTLPLSEHLRLPPATVREAGLRVLRMVGLDEFADFYPNQLSGGMRKRAGLARAIVAEPRILLCDEPTSGLDPLMEAVFQDCVEEVAHAGKTVLLSSHILAEVEALCDRVSIIRDGRTVEEGTLSELRHLTRTSVAAETQRPIGGLDGLGGVHDAASASSDIAG